MTINCKLNTNVHWGVGQQFVFTVKCKEQMFQAYALRAERLKFLILFLDSCKLMSAEEKKHMDMT